MNQTQPPFSFHSTSTHASDAVSVLDIDLSSEGIDSTQSLTGGRSSCGAHSSSSSLAETISIVDAHSGRKRVLVTGGAGFLGSHVADALLQRGDEVVVVDSVDDQYDPDLKESTLKVLALLYGPERVKIYRGNVCDENFLDGVFETERPEWVCHLAAHAGIRASLQDPASCIHTNVDGTTRVLEAAARFGVKNVVLASSGSVYDGSASDALLSEDDPAVDQPMTPYAASKRACELLAFAYHRAHGLNVSCLRLFTVYGPRGRPDSVPLELTVAILRGIPIHSLLADESCSRDCTYVSDVVDGILRALDRPYPYQIFNLGQGRSSSFQDFASHVEQTAGQSSPSVPSDDAIDTANPYVSLSAPCADIRKARRLLGYRPRVSLAEGVHRTVEWYVHSGGGTGSSRQENGVVPERGSSEPRTSSAAAATEGALSASVSMGSIARSMISIEYQDDVSPVVVVPSA